MSSEALTIRSILRIIKAGRFRKTAGAHWFFVCWGQLDGCLGWTLGPFVFEHNDERRMSSRVVSWVILLCYPDSPISDNVHAWLERSTMF